MENELLNEALHWRSLLAKAVEEKGADYVYPVVVRGSESLPPCTYATYDRNAQPIGPSCLVGHALYYDGVPIKTLGALDEIGAIDDDGADEHSHISAQVREALATAQSFQDQEEAWGRALDAYDRDCVRNIPGYKEAVK